MKQPTDEERASMERARLTAACDKKLGEKTAEAKAELAALIARYEADPSGFGHEAISTALLKLTVDRYLVTTMATLTALHVPAYARECIEHALRRKAEEPPPMRTPRIVDTDNDENTGGHVVVEAKDRSSTIWLRPGATSAAFRDFRPSPSALSKSRDIRRDSFSKYVC